MNIILRNSRLIFVSNQIAERALCLGVVLTDMSLNTIGQKMVENKF